MRQAVAGDVSLEQLRRHGSRRLAGHLPLRSVNDAGGTLAELFMQHDLRSSNRG